MDKWLSHPNALKIISVVIGLILWGVVHFDPTSAPNKVASYTETKIIEAVSVRNTGLAAEEYAITSIQPTVVRFYVSGSKSSLLSASDQDYAANIDVSGLEPGTHTVSVTPKLPVGIELLNMSPNQVQVTIDRLGTNTFEAGIVTQGKAADGYQLGSPIVLPNNQVKVTLPEAKLAQVASVKVFVNVEGATETFTEKKAAIKVFSRTGDEIKDAVIAPASLQVEVPIIALTKTVPLVIGYTGELPAGMSIQSIQADVQKVTLSGAQSVLDKLDQLEAYLNLSGLPDSVKVRLELQPPEGITSVDPKTVNVTVKLATSASRSVNVPITLMNLPAGLKATVVDHPDNQITLELFGSQQHLASLSEIDMSATADLSGLGAGEHAVTLKLILPPNVTAAGGNSPTVNIILQSDDHSVEPSENSPGNGGNAGGTGTTGPTGSTGTSGQPGSPGSSGSSGTPGSTGSSNNSGNTGDATGGTNTGGSAPVDGTTGTKNDNSTLGKPLGAPDSGSGAPGPGNSTGISNSSK